MIWFTVLLVLSVGLLVVWYLKNNPQGRRTSQEKTLDEILGQAHLETTTRPPSKLQESLPVVTLEADVSRDRNDQAWFDRTVDSLLMQLDGDTRLLREMAKLLISEAVSGNHHRGRVRMQKELVEGSWRWPEFERQWGERQRAENGEHVTKIRGMQAGDVLDALRLQDLRKLAAGQVKARSKAELIEALQISLAPEAFHALVEQGRHSLLEALPDPDCFDYGEQCSVFLHRLTALAYGKRNLEELRASPMREQLKAVFRAGGTMNTPKACILRNGHTFALNDPQLDALAPCGRLDCSCSISTAVEGWRRSL